MRTFQNEADLCGAFVEWVRGLKGRDVDGRKAPTWTPYTETAGWDILLAADDGHQIGIEAKFAFNMKVLAQAVKTDRWDSWRGIGPDFRAVLVPKYHEDHQAICNALGLELIYPRHDARGDFFQCDLRTDGESFYRSRMYWNPAEREKLPVFVPDGEAGHPSPIRLTDWKIKALRIVARLALRGYVTRDDFKALKLDPRLWIQGPKRWVIPGAVPGQFVRGDCHDFDLHHPIVYAQVLEEERATFQPLVPAVPAQGAMFTEAA